MTEKLEITKGHSVTSIIIIIICFAENAMAKELLMLMEQKQSNLSVAGTFFVFEKKLHRLTLLSASSAKNIKNALVHVGDCL